MGFTVDCTFPAKFSGPGGETIDQIRKSYECSKWYERLLLPCEYGGARTTHAPERGESEKFQLSIIFSRRWFIVV